MLRLSLRYTVYMNKVIPCAYKTSDLVTPKKQSSRHVSTFAENTINLQSGIFKTLSECTPVELLQTGLIQVHTMTGLPWWLSIICCTVGLRAAFTLPLTIYQHYVMAKLEHLNVEMKEIIEDLKKETAMAVHMYKWDERTAKYQFKRSAKKQWQNLIIRDNCHPVKAALLPWVQIPLWVCCSVSLRNLVYQLPAQTQNAHATYLELTTGGFLWIENLCLPDSTWIIPVMLGLTNLAIIEIQLAARRTETTTKVHRVATHVFRGLTILMVPLAAWVPSCMALYWVTSSVYGLTQNLFVLSPRLRRKCGIPQTSTELKTPYYVIYTRLRAKYFKKLLPKQN